MAKKINFFILSGDPGVGKTTLTKKICLLLNEKGVKTVGFFTEEVRRNQVREGFDVVSLNGERGRLAREKSLLSSPAQHTVGKYDVLLQEFENIALQSMRMIIFFGVGATNHIKSRFVQLIGTGSKIFYYRTTLTLKPEDNETCVLVIDEIGKMEFFSTNFKSRIKEIFSPASKNIVLATIPVRQSDPLIESIRNNSRSKVWIVTRANRNTIHEEIEREIYKAIKI